MSVSYRVAGWGMLGFGIAFVVAFIVNSLVGVVAGFPEWADAAQMAGQFWWGVVFLLLWGVAGVALAVAVQGLVAVAWPDGGLAARIASSLGTVATAGWLFSGAGGLAQRTALLNENIAARHADAAAEGAVIEGLYSLVHVGGILFATALLPALGLAAVRLARTHALSRVVLTLLWIGAAAPLLGYALTGLQIGILATMIAFIVAGSLVLRVARRRTDDGSAVIGLTAADTAGA